MAAFVAAAAVAAAPAPNVVFLWADDVGYGDIGCFGNATMKTPNIDRLAASGTALTAHYVATPLCTPSRAGLLTGRHAVRTGMTSSQNNFGVMGLGPGALPLDELTVAEALRDIGYSTAMVGKWHLGGPANGNALPTRHGFESYWGMPHTNAQACRAGHKEYVHATLFGFVATRDPTDKVLAALLLVLLTPWAFGRAGRRWRLPAAALAVGAAAVVFWMTSTLTLLNQRGACVLYANETLVEQPVEIGYLTLRHTEQATAFLERAPRPFFLHLAYPNAHTALFAMDSSVGRSAHGAYGDNVEEMDWSIGVVLDKLDALGETDNSIVYFASDNGPFREELEEGGSCGFAPILPPGAPLAGPASSALARAGTRLRGAKGQTWECGVRVPAAIAWPARWASGWAVHAATSALDIMPTVLAAAGALDGRVSWASQLREGEKAGAGVLDGRDLAPWLVAGGRTDEGEGDGEDGFRMLYCGGLVSAVRHGRFKVHYTSAKWEDEEAQICVRNVICDCHGHTHEPPLLFDLHADPAETTPLDTRVPEHAALLARIGRAKARHEASVTPVQSQTELVPSPSHFPCCGEEKGTLPYAYKLLTNQCGC